MARVRDKAKRAEAELREFALSLPEAYEEFPWGDRALKVKGKVFVFMGSKDGGFGMSTKLPDTAAAALSLPFTSPTGYGLGKSGWVSAMFTPGEQPPVELLKMWIQESYQAVAPKKLVALLGKPAGDTVSRPIQRSARSKRPRGAARTSPRRPR